MGHLPGARLLWGMALSHFQDRGRVPSRHLGHHSEAVEAGMRTSTVPNGFVNAEKWPSSYFLLSHASHLWSDGGSGLHPEGVQPTMQGAGWHFVLCYSYSNSAQQDCAHNNEQWVLFSYLHTSFSLHIMNVLVTGTMMYGPDLYIFEIPTVPFK